MASTSFLNQFQDLDFNNEEQGAVFTPTIQWDSMNDDSNLLIIGKMISSNPIDDNAVVHAFQGIWKHDKIVSITTVKSNYYRIKFPTEDIRNDILSRGPWNFKGDWLALAALNPNYSIDEYTFLSMNVWMHIYGIPSILMDDDDIANHTGNSLVVDTDSTNAPTTLVDVNINVPVVAVFEPQSTKPFGSTMVPTMNSFGGPEGFIDFFANPIETPTVVPYLLDNMGLDAVTTTILPIPWEGGLENDMATIDEGTPLVIARGAKRRSSMQNDNKIKKPRPPNCFKD
ncbi:hypothetical protein V6N13_072204 [Hibiscus sabdariffa]